MLSSPLDLRRRKGATVDGSITEFGAMQTVLVGEGGD